MLGLVKSDEDNAENYCRYCEYHSI
jgi:hypothetical protein